MMMIWMDEYRSKRFGDEQSHQSLWSAISPMSTRSKMAADTTGFTFLLVPVGILVHIVYLASIFDIYFTSPLVHGMEPFKSTLEPPARRLVLFVADGLRADKFYEMNEKGATRAPYLRHVIENKGSWGVSHTRVPTESRPGHVALIAGFYEDVSAVAKGWKENPVEFDSAFNESRYTWSWGSPDILPMFAKGATGDHVFTSMYPVGMEDFADKDASKLDSWVFDEVKSFFDKAKDDEVLAQKLSERKIIFFLHLLGIDTNGHAHRPTSDEYLNNIAFVDQGIKKMVHLFEDYYGNDGKTAYIMTSDHGMTNWGSHGAGHAHETLTPLVAWGAGLRGPILNTDNDGDHNDKETFKWKLSHLKRSDVNQADIAPLMTSLIGAPFPLNSVGIVPVEYFNNTALFTAENLLNNARQILAQYQIKEEYRRKTSLIFRPFKSLPGSKQVGMVRDIKELLHSEKYKKASRLSKELINLSLKGLNYYQNYDRVFLNTVVTLGFLGWIMSIVLWITLTHTDILQQTAKSSISPIKPLLQDKNVDTFFISLGLAGAVILFYQSAPFMYYVYCVLPIMFWDYIFKKLHIIKSIFNYISRNKLTKKLSFTLILGLISVEILVLSFFQREILCVGLLCFSLWIFSTKLLSLCPATALAWMLTTGSLAVFPMMPVVGRDANYSLVTLAGFFTVIVFLGILLLCSRISEEFRQELQKSSSVLLYQFVAIVFAIYNVNTTSSSLKQKKGLPLLNQVSSWTILFSSFVAPLFSSKNLVIRMTSIVLGLTSSYLLMSTAYEGLFLLTLSLLMSSWLVCEHKLSGGTLKSLLEIQIGSDHNAEPNPTWNILDGPSIRPLTLEDLRCSYFFIFFIITAFFGTGNIASINSFDPSSVYCFLTLFSPFLMGSLLLCKVFIPFVIVTSAFDAVHIILQVPVHSLFLVVLVLTDIMGLHFFYFVKDYGSWLEIGTSISHFVIMMTFIIFLFFIFGLTRLFTGTFINLTQKKKKN